MELPKQFKSYQNLIDVIRVLIYPNYLKTKEEQLRWYVYYVHDRVYEYSYIKDYVDNWHSKQISFTKKKKYYDLSTCSVVYETECEPVKMYLNENDVHLLLKNAFSSTIKHVLKNTLVPDNSNIKYLVEADVGKEIYPLDKNCLFIELSFELIRDNPGLFNDSFLSKREDKSYVLIKNNINNKEFNVNKRMFDTYCHFNDLIELSKDEQINEITVPFAFNEKSSKYFLDCLAADKFIQPDKDIDKFEFDEFKELMTYFEVAFVQ